MQPRLIFRTCFLKCYPSRGWKTVPFSLAIPELMGEANFPDVLFYLILAFISFDKDLLVLKLAGSLFYTEILVQLLPATSGHH